MVHAILKLWAHSTGSTRGLTWFWRTSDMARCSSHMSQSAGRCLPRWQRGLPLGWRCSDDCRLAHSLKRTCTSAIRRASGSGSGSPTCLPASWRQSRHVLSCTTDFQTGKSFPMRGTGEESHLSDGLVCSCLNIHICLSAKKNGDKEQAEYWAAPVAWTLPRLVNWWRFCLSTETSRTLQCSARVLDHGCPENSVDF